MPEQKSAMTKEDSVRIQATQAGPLSLCSIGSLRNLTTLCRPPAVPTREQIPSLLVPRARGIEMATLAMLEELQAPEETRATTRVEALAERSRGSEFPHFFVVNSL